MANKALIGGMCAILLVAAVVGIVAGFMHSHHSTLGGSGGFSTTSKSIAAICAPTDYREACEQTLSAAVNGTADNKAIIQAAVKATIEEVKSAFHYSGNISSRVTDDYHKLVLDDCKHLLADAVDELTAVFDETHDIKGMTNRSADIKTWLSAVISYQQTCLDGFNDTDLKKAMGDGLDRATQLTSNALAIFNAISKLFGELGKIDLSKLSFGAGGRRLLAEDGYPVWFSAGDRRLLAHHDEGRLTPNVVVAKDGSGNFRTINDALNSMPKDYSGRYVIYVKAGIYEENVIVEKDKINVFMYGDGSRKSIVSGSKNNVDGVPTFQTATFSALGQGFIAKSMGFRNTAGAAKHQAVALRVQSDMSAFIRCRMDGYQDTLYAQTHRQFYRNCVISGTVDFIFGDSSTILQNCLIIVRRPMDNQQNTVTAHGRSDRHEITGLVIHNCRIVPDMRLFPDRFKIPSYLGRPWKEYSRTVVMESTIGDLIRPEGWMPWDGDFALDTLYYAEYANRGPGAVTGGRVRWPGFHVIGRDEALQFTVAPFINGDLWLKYTGARYILGLKH